MKKIGLILLIGMLIVASLSISSCAKKIPLSAEQQVYAGKWVASDGTFIQIFLDGSGNLQTANAQISGGSAVIADGVLTISLMGIKKNYTITAEPVEISEEGTWIMVLDNIQYTRQ